MKIWQLTDGEVSEGKYLVVRRDGTIPWWPSFIMGGHDPATAAGLEGYAAEAERLGYEPEYVASVRELAAKFRALAAEKRGKVDPEAGPHRRDNPAVVAMMRGDGDLSGLKEIPEADSDVYLYAQGWRPVADAPLDGTKVDLRADAVIVRGCYWGLCDVDHSPHGAFDWVMAPAGFRPTHFRLPKPES